MNSLELILEELASVNLISIYHSSTNPNLSGTMANDDFSPGIFGAGKMYGAGFYSVWKKEDLNNYGNFFYKGYVNFRKSKILVLDPEFYREIYKKEMPENYLETVLPIEKENISVKNTIRELQKEILERATNYKIFLALNKINELSDMPNLFDGMAYYGKKDGHCLLMWNYHKVNIVGKYSRRKDKTNIKLKEYKKQKNIDLSNKSIFKDKENKIVERDNKYIFFHNGKIILTLDRTQKDENKENIFYGRDIKKVLKDNDFPISVINKLTLTNGKKIIELKNIVKTYNSRNKEKVELRDKDIIQGLDDGVLFKSIYSVIYYSKRKGIKKANNPFLSTIQRMLDNNASFRNKFEKELFEVGFDIPIKIENFYFLPTFLVKKNKNLVLDFEGESSLENPLSKRESENFFNFIGDVKKSPKKVYIDLKDAIKLLPSFIRRKDNKLKDVKIIFITKPEDTATQEKISSYPKNCILINPNPLSLSKGIKKHREALPPCIFTKEGFKKKQVFLGDTQSIDFGRAKKFWTFPQKVKIIYSDKLEKKSLANLKRRNPTCIFIKHNSDNNE